VVSYKGKTFLAFCGFRLLAEAFTEGIQNTVGRPEVTVQNPKVQGRELINNRLTYYAEHMRKFIIFMITSLEFNISLMNSNIQHSAVINYYNLLSFEMC